MTEKLYTCCDRIKEITTEHDYDWIHVIEGPEGVGKTSLAWIMSKYLHPKMKVSYVFNFDEFRKAVSTAKPGDVILIDEGAFVFYSRDSMSRPNKDAVKMMTAIRSKNLIIIICVPNYLILDTYLRNHRVKTLARVVMRGWVWHFGPRKTKTLKASKHNPMKIDYPDYDFRDTFPDAAKLWPEEWAEYKKKKEESTIKPEKPEQEITGRPFLCKKCEYKWPYSGKNDIATCPKCGKKAGFERKSEETI